MHEILQPENRSVKKVLTPLLVAIADQLHQLPRGIQSEGPGSAGQANPGFLGGAVALAVVAAVAVATRFSRKDRRPANAEPRDREWLGTPKATPQNWQVLRSRSKMFLRERARLLRDVAIGQQANHRDLMAREVN